MKPAATLLAEGRAALATVGRSAFCAAEGVASEAEYKRRCRDSGRLTYHMHLGLSDWAATEQALAHVSAGLAEHGHRIDRFGLCLSRSMGVPGGAARGRRQGDGAAPGGVRLGRGRRAAPPSRTSATS